MQASRGYFDKQKQIVLDRLPQIAGKGVKRDTGVAPFDMGDQTKVLIELLAPIYADHLREAGQYSGLLVGLTQFDMDSPAIVAFLTDRNRKVSGDINEETDKQLRATLAQGISNGDSIPELAARVEAVYGAAAGYRAERIARTEARRTSTEAEVEAWDQSGVVEAKEWFTAKDERVCPFCAPMDGRIVGLQGQYYQQGHTLTVPQLDKNGDPVTDDNGDVKTTTLKLDYEDIEGPPLHVSCRCDLLPVLIDASQL